MPSSQLMAILISAVGGVAVMFLVQWMLHQTPAGAASSQSDRFLWRRQLRERACRSSALFAMMLPAIRVVAAVLRPLPLSEQRRQLSTLSMRAGYPGGLDADELLAVILLLGGGIGAMLGMLFASVTGPTGGLAGVLGLPIGYLLVNSSLHSTAELRQKMIIRTMPYVLDLAVLILRAGGAFSVALRMVVDEYDGHPVGEEFGQALSEIELGATQREAMARVVERVDVEEVRIFVETVNQADELGWPLAETLERQADQLNVRRQQRADEVAGTSAAMIMLPSTLILAATILLLLGPVLLGALLGDQGAVE